MALAPRAPEPGEFTDVPGDTQLTVVESAFDHVRRAKPFRGHEDRWAAQTA